jgi:hypothetical protein
VHTPTLHDCPDGHGRSQAPQLRASVWRFAQTPAQKVVPGAQVLRQAPPEHAVPGAQLTPHAPQLKLLLAVSTSQPSSGTPLQFAKPGEQPERPHTPPLQVAPAFGRLHARPQAPQLRTSEPTLVSHPLSSTPSQLAKPALQVPTRHAPSAQRGVALALAQRAPHAPQWFTDSRSAVSQPSARSALQSPKFGAQRSPQLPPAHSGAAFCAPEHVRPQAPQWLGSSARRAQRSTQKVAPPVQSDTQDPP